MSHRALPPSNTPDLSTRVARRIPNFPPTVESKLIDHPKNKTIDLYRRQSLARFVAGEYARAAREAFMLAYARDDASIENTLNAPDVALENRRFPLHEALPIVFGGVPNDGGHLLLSASDKAALLAREPKAEKWLRRVYGSEEFINNGERWCLWLVGIPPDELRALPAVRERVEAVHRHRLASTRPATRQLAATPTLLGEIRQPADGQYLLIPKVSSERRLFIPIGILPAEIVSTDLNFIVPHATLAHFGILHSTMHMAWVRAVCGRLKSDYRYSAGIVYNNFPWPDPSDKQRAAIETAAQAVLDARAQFPNATLADLYDPLTMPPQLLKAHQVLDRAVDAAYGRKSFASEAERVAFLFERYQALTSLLPEAKAKKRTRRA